MSDDRILRQLGFVGLCFALAVEQINTRYHFPVLDLLDMMSSSIVCYSLIHSVPMERAENPAT